MKIAYLIAAHNNYAHLEKLVRALNEKDASFYIYIDRKSPLPQLSGFPPNVHFIEDRIKVYWAGFSQVEATLKLLTVAQAAMHDYYILISGVDYPIRPNETLRQQLNEGGEFISMIKGFATHKPETRIQRYSFDRFDRRDLRSIKTISFLATERMLSLFVKRGYPFKEIYHGSNWFAVTNNCVHYILEFVAHNPDYSKFYSNTRHPDESFFQTIIGNSDFLKNVKTNLTYVNWNNSSAGPAMINAEDVIKFKRQKFFQTPYGLQQPFFARKFSDQSTEIVKLIEKELRTPDS